MFKKRLGVNIDHVATLREARKTPYPSPLKAAQIALEAGADLITLHLREDRRHIQDADLLTFQKNIQAPLNLEMALTEEMLQIASTVGPTDVCLVPEKREELTTEGGLDAASLLPALTEGIQHLHTAGIRVSCFIDPSKHQIEACKQAGADSIELHTGLYAEHPDDPTTLQALKEASTFAHAQGLQVNAGHGLTQENLPPLVHIPELQEFNIGHALIADAVFDGLRNTVMQYKALLEQ